MPRGNHMRTLKRYVGVVVSTGMDKTAVVLVPRLQIHGLTRKIVKTYTKCFCHDEHEICGVGDKVQVKQVAKISKKKSWAVIDMIARHPQLGGEPFEMSKLKTPPLLQ